MTNILYEGKGKVLYKGPEPGTVIQHFKDDATAFNNKKHALFEGKGVLNNKISSYIFGALERFGIATHFIRILNMREQLVRHLRMIPCEVVVRNVAAGSLVKRLGLQEGFRLDRPLLEFYYKSDALNDPLISEEHIEILNIASSYDIEEMRNAALRINDMLSGLFWNAGLLLVDFKLEFGHAMDDDAQGLVLGDEISPDGARLWDQKTGEKLDKDIFRNQSGNLLEAYQDVARRLGV